MQNLLLQLTAVSVTAFVLSLDYNRTELKKEDAGLSCYLHKQREVRERSRTEAKGENPKSEHSYAAA